MDAIATTLKDNPYLKIRIIGHTCNTGSHQTNTVVGQRRAEAVKKALMERGVLEDQLVTTSMAELQPIVPNDTDAHRQKNRRVEVESIP